MRVLGERREPQRLGGEDVGDPAAAAAPCRRRCAAVSCRRDREAVAPVLALGPVTRGVDRQHQRLVARARAPGRGASRLTLAVLHQVELEPVAAVRRGVARRRGSRSWRRSRGCRAVRPRCGRGGDRALAGVVAEAGVAGRREHDRRARRPAQDRGRGVRLGDAGRTSTAAARARSNAARLRAIVRSPSRSPSRRSPSTAARHAAAGRRARGRRRSGSARGGAAAGSRDHGAGDEEGRDVGPPGDLARGFVGSVWTPPHLSDKFINTSYKLVDPEGTHHVRQDPQPDPVPRRPADRQPGQRRQGAHRPAEAAHRDRAALRRGHDRAGPDRAWASPTPSAPAARRSSRTSRRSPRSRSGRTRATSRRSTSR